MTTELKVQFSNDRDDKVISAKENLWDYGWTKYRKIEDCISVDAKFNSQGEIEGINFGAEDSKNSIADIQENIAKLVLQDKDIQIEEVQVHTVKNILQAYSDDLEKLSLKIKKKQTE